MTGVRHVDITLPYGAETLEAKFDWGQSLGMLDVAPTPGLADPVEALRAALADPIGMDGPALQAFKPSDRVAILVSDSFRKTGIEQVLPVLVDELNGRGIPDANIQFVFATGTHRGPTPEEQEQILGVPVYARFKDTALAHNPHDAANHVHLGATSRGTDVAINKQVAECDRIIATGAAVFHYFGGFGGGRKSVLPGISSVATISQNHSLNLDRASGDLDAAVEIGKLDGNPVAEDMLEAAQMARVDCIVNTVMNRDGRIAGLFVGDLDAAHRAAAAFARDQFAVPMTDRADLVIAASAGTKNFVQTHKALFNAYLAVKPQGRIILLAKCPEGLGGEQFIQWVRLGSREKIIAELLNRSEINGQTALSAVQKSPITIMVTDMDAADVALLGARKADSLDAALAMARAELTPAEPSYYLMPSAPYSVPFVE